MEKVKLLIDTDIGDEIDDAMALYFAMSQGFELVGITTVFKNTDERARIAKRLLKLYGRGYENIPVLAGHGTPIGEKAVEYAHTCHYHDAISSDEYAPDGDADAAVDFIIECCERYGEELCIVAIGPFTNIARAIERNAQAVNNAGKVVIMGGAYYRQYADWNVMCDARAADIMFRSLKNLECVGADVTHKTVLCRDEHEVMLNCKNDAAAIEIAELIRLWSVVNPDRYPTLHDPLAVYYAVHPDVCEVEKQRIAVLTEGYAKGLTLNLDAYNKAYMNPACDSLDKAHTVIVAKKIDAKKFIDIFIHSFNKR